MTRFHFAGALDSGALLLPQNIPQMQNADCPITCPITKDMRSATAWPEINLLLLHHRRAPVKCSWLVALTVACREFLPGWHQTTCQRQRLTSNHDKGRQRAAGCKGMAARLNVRES